MIAVEFENAETNKKIIDALLQVSGDSKSPDTSPAVFTDWFFVCSSMFTNCTAARNFK